MLITDSDRLLKRINRKKKSTDLAIRLKIYVGANYPEDEKFIKRMQRQIDCNSKLVEYEDGTITSWFCDCKICYICNSLRLVKFLKKYLNAIKQEPFKYHMVLTVRNPELEDLKNKIDKMYLFFQNSGLKKNKTFREYKKNIKMIRSFETTFNVKRHSFNIHYHFLLAGQNENDVNLFGQTTIQCWHNYFGEDANYKAQYLMKQKKSELENFKYLLKLNDITDSNLHMLYHLLNATYRKRLFEKMNIKAIKVEKDERQDLKGKIIKCHFYSDKINNYYDSDSKELLVNDKLIRDAKRVKIERKHQRIVSNYFKEVSNK